MCAVLCMFGKLAKYTFQCFQIQVSETIPWLLVEKSAAAIPTAIQARTLNLYRMLVRLLPIKPLESSGNKKCLNSLQQLSFYRIRN